MTRNRILLATAACGVALVAAGIVFRHDLTTRTIAFRLVRATDDDHRRTLAEDLVARGPAALPGLLAGGTPETRMALIDAVGQLTSSDPNFAPCAAAVFDAAAAFDEAALAAALSLTPCASAVPELTDKAKAVVSAALVSGPSAKSAACRIAPRFDLTTAVVPLLADADANVRVAAVLAVGPASGGEAAVPDEALFRLLSDPSPAVRAVTEAALGTRGLDDRQIALARKLAHGDAAERLSLLFDLRWAGDTIKDPGPWLARLAKDPDPAVRAGAARAAKECGCTTAEWVNDLADRDPDPLVRHVAGHYRPRTGDTIQTGGR